MKLLDKLRSQPEWQSDDPAIRAAAVRELSDDAQDQLVEIALNDADAGVRRAAVGRLSDVDALIAAAGDDDDGVREEARSVLRDVTIDADEAAMGETALQALGDERDLSAVARFAVLPAIRLMALARVEDEKILALIARRAEDPEIATAALARVTRLDELTTVAMKTDDKLVALAAYDRLIADTDMRADLLDQLARRARQKAVARRARAAHDTLVADVPVEEATLTRAPSLCKELESIATLDTIAEMRHRLDEVVLAWAALDETVTPELAARFAAAREGVESRLVALDAPQRESRLAADRRATALAGRVALAERVERLLDDNPSVLAAIREEWAALGTGDPIDDAVVSRDDVDAVSRRFDAAVAACEQRREQRVAGLDHIRELETLVVELEALVPVEAPDPVAVGAGWSRLDGRWRELIAGVRRGQAAADREMAARLAALETRRNAVASRRRALGAEAKAAREHEAQKNLTRLEKLWVTFETAATTEKLELGQAQRQLRMARQTLAELGPLPSRRDREALTKRLTAAQTALLGRVRELRDFADWQRWANLGIQEELCRKMEALAVAPETEPIASVAHHFRELMNRWRDAAQVPKDRGEELWQRFKRAHDIVFPRCEEYFDTQTREREDNLKRKQLLVEEAEGLATSTSWIKTAQRITALQAEWQAIGPAPRKDQRQLWNRFRAACGAFFARRKVDLADRKKAWAANLAKKDALTARVEALAEAEDLTAAIEEVKKAQAEWKTIGPVKRSRSDAIWERFRAACDQVFQHSQQVLRQASIQKIELREALCGQLEAFLPPAPGAETEGGDTPSVETASDNEPFVAPADLAERVREIQGLWRAGPEVPREIQRQLSARFGRAVSRLVEAYPDQFRGTDLDPARALKRLQKLVERAEALLPSETLDQRGASPAEILATKWREALASNTMGVKIDPGAQRRAAMDEAKRLQADRRQLGPVPGDDGRRLAERFRKACDRIFLQGRADAGAPPRDKPRPSKPRRSAAPTAG